MLASELGADLVVPPALKRNSFIGVFTGKAATSTSKYTMTPFSSLFDQAKLFGHLRGAPGAADEWVPLTQQCACSMCMHAASILKLFAADAHTPALH